MKNKKDYSTGFAGFSAIGIILIIFILAMSNKCNAQTDTTNVISFDSSWTWIDDLMPIYFGQDINFFSFDDTVFAEKSFEEKLSDLLIEYADECYQDSTLTTVYIDPNKKTYIGNGVWFSTALGGNDKQVWIHKEPIFPGFIEWIKARNKK